MTRDRWLAAYPVTTVTVGAAIGLQVATLADHDWYATLAAHARFSYADLVAGRLPRMVASTFVQSRAGILWSICLLLCFVAFCERRIGPAHTAAAFFLGDWLSSIITLVILRLAPSFGVEVAREALVTGSSGSSAACYSCIAAFIVATSSRVWRRRLALALALDLAIQAAVSHMLSDLQHPIACAIGAAIGIHALRTRERHGTREAGLAGRR